MSDQTILWNEQVSIDQLRAMCHVYKEKNTSEIQIIIILLGEILIIKYEIQMEHTNR